MRLSIFAGHFMRGLSAITVITRTLQAPQNQEAGFISPDINSYEKKNNARFFKGWILPHERKVLLVFVLQKFLELLPLFYE